MPVLLIEFALYLSLVPLRFGLTMSARHLCLLQYGLLAHLLEKKLPIIVVNSSRLLVLPFYVPPVGGINPNPDNLFSTFCAPGLGVPGGTDGPTGATGIGGGTPNAALGITVGGNIGPA